MAARARLLYVSILAFGAACGEPADPFEIWDDLHAEERPLRLDAEELASLLDGDPEAIVFEFRQYTVAHHQGSWFRVRFSGTGTARYEGEYASGRDGVWEAEVPLELFRAFLDAPCQEAFAPPDSRRATLYASGGPDAFLRIGDGAGWATLTLPPRHASSPDLPARVLDSRMNALVERLAWERLE